MFDLFLSTNVDYVGRTTQQHRATINPATKYIALSASNRAGEGDILGCRVNKLIGNPQLCRGDGRNCSTRKLMIYRDLTTIHADADMKHWNTYWEAGHLHSLPGLFHDNYTGSLRKFWESTFARLPSEAKIIDLGTGNGALALMALEYSRRHKLSFEVTGIDSANISPSIPEFIRQHPSSIRFLSKTEMTSTGLPENYFDLAISQYSIEYAPMTETIRELDRILKKHRGGFAAIVHHESSVILSRAKQTKRQINHCKNSGLLSICVKMLEIRERMENHVSAQEKQIYNSLLKQFTSKSLKLKKFQPQMENPEYLQQFLCLLNDVLDPSKNTNIPINKRLRLLTEYQEQTTAYMKRLGDLQAAAYSGHDFDQLTQELRKTGLQVMHLAPIFHHASFIGFSIRAMRNSCTP